MSWVAIGAAAIGAVSSIYSANKQEDAAENAANQYKDVKDQQLPLHDAAYAEQQGFYEPYRQGGLQAQQRLMDLLGMNGADPSAALAKDPGYQFRLSEGLKALDRSAAARGRLISGASLKGAQRFGQGLASQEFDNAYKRLMPLYETGFNTAGNLSSAAGNRATNKSNVLGGFASSNASTILGAGNAKAAGMMGAGNAIQGGLNNYQNQQNQQKQTDLLGSLLGGAGGALGGLLGGGGGGGGFNMDALGGESFGDGGFDLGGLF